MKTFMKTVALALAFIFVISAALPAMASEPADEQPEIRSEDMQAEEGQANDLAQLESEPKADAEPVNDSVAEPEPEPAPEPEQKIEPISDPEPAGKAEPETAKPQPSFASTGSGASSSAKPAESTGSGVLSETIEDVPVTNMATGSEVTVDVQVLSDIDTVSNAEFQETVEDIENMKTAAASPVLLMALGASSGNKTVYLYNDGVVSYGGYGTHKYRVTIDGKTTYAYCLEPPKAGPDNGNYTATPATNALLAIALYYMMGGPALEVGRIIRQSRAQGKDAAEEAAKAVEGKVLFKGTVTSLEYESTGYMIGESKIEGLDDYADKQMVIWFKNENHLAKVDDKVVATSPDIIEVVDIASGEPITNSTISVGKRVAVIGAPHKAYRTKEALARIEPRSFGFDRDYIEIEKLW